MECRMLKQAHKITNDCFFLGVVLCNAESEWHECRGNGGRDEHALAGDGVRAERAQQMLEIRLSCVESTASAAADRARKAASEAALSARAALKAKVDATQPAVAASASAEMLQNTMC